MADATIADSKDLSCNVVPRVVAAGAARRADGWRLRVTVALMPARETGGPSIPIADWPVQIGPKVIDALQIRISPVKVEAGKRPEPRQPDPQSPQPMVSWLRRGSAPGVGLHAEKVGDLWKRAMAPPDAEGNPWKELLDALTPSGAAATPDDDPKDIVSMPRSEAALLISLKRARDALQRMPHADPQQKAAFEPGWDHCGQQPWMGSSDAPKCTANGNSDEAERILSSLELDLGQAAKLRERQEGYFKAADPASMLKAKLCDASLAASPQHLARRIAGPQVPAVAQAQNRLRNLHTASTLQGIGDDVVPDSPPTPTPSEAAVRRLMGLHSQPALQRLFDMTVDLEIRLDRNGLREWIESSAQSTGFEDECVPNATLATPAMSRYLFIGAGFKGSDAPPYLWTAAKLSLPIGGHSDEAHFWPCTREEIELRVAEKTACSDPGLRAAIHLRDGVVDLGAAMCEGPRWDIMTLDTMAVESEIQASCCDLAALASGRPLSADCRPTLRTLGMALIDRARQAHAIDESVAMERLLRQPKGGVLYAGDLCTGYRMDIGVPRAGTQAFEWRGLNNRHVRFTDPKHKGDRWIDEVLAHCFREDRDETLQTLLAGQVNSPPRLLSLKESARRIGFAEEKVAEWNGDPLGIECKPSVVEVDGRHDLGINITYDLPTDGGSRPPALRLGWRYRIGLRPVFAGGVALPVSRAASAYNSAMQGSLALPESRQRARRFLRHERIESPLLALPKTDLLALRSSGRNELPTAPTVVVRSTPDAVDSLFNTPKAHRVLVAPVVPQAFAAWHGVFDRSTARHPDDGLPAVDFEGEEGGFPVLDGNGSVVNCPPDNSDRRDAVFQLKSAPLKDSSAKREKLPCYPDPAARHIVLALRFRTGDCAWLAGKPQSVDLYAGGLLKYPHAAVVLVEVVAADKRTSAAKQDTLLQHDPVLDVGVMNTTRGFRASSLANWTSASADVPTMRVRVMLAPGEDFDLVSWCAADGATLTRWFDVVESAALVCAASVCGEQGSRAPDQDMARGFASLCGGRLPKASVPAGENASLLCGSGGLDLPSFPQLIRLGEALHAAMLKRPNPEISSWSSTRVMHAVSRPRRAPRFVEHGGAHVPVRPLRTHFRDVVQQLDWIGKNPVATWNEGGWPEGWTPSGTDAKSENDPAKADGATDVLLGGTVLVELNTTGGLEVHGLMAFPAHGRFDDPARRMTDLQRARGEFPANPEYTWGFAVDRDGNVTLPRQPVCMLRFDKLEQPTTRSDRVDQLEPLDILLARKTVQQGACDPNPCAETELRSRTARHVFDDTKARRVTLSMIAYSRFDAEMGKVRGKVLPPKPVGSENTLDIWIPSMKRPDRIDPKTLLPTFVWPSGTAVRGSIRVERRCRVRLRLQRPWFSSGEDERLGLVVWPRDLVQRHGAKLAGNVATTVDGSKDQSWPVFTDASLGRAGSYITRWGADPIRKGPTPQGWFMPLEAFRDLIPENGGPARATWVPDVRMPVPGNDDEPVMSEERFLTVSLLTYVPKFDWREEQWYVDLDIDPLDLPYPFVRLGLVRYQPHAHPDLRLSEPVVEWVQLMPRRTVNVTFGEAKNNIYPVTVEVEGRASLRAGHDSAIQQPDDEGPKTLQRHRPIVRMRMMRRDDTYGLEHASESVAADAHGNPLVWDSGEDWNHGDSRDTQQPRRTNDGLSWTHTFGLTENPLAAGERFAVFIEEVERMRPASYFEKDEQDGVKQPLRELTQQIELDTPLVESGPRFMAYIPLVRKESLPPC